MKRNTILILTAIVTTTVVAMVFILPNLGKDKDSYPAETNTTTNNTTNISSNTTISADDGKNGDAKKESQVSYAPVVYYPVEQSSKNNPTPAPIPTPTPVPDPEPEPTLPEEKMVPGLRTVKNFLATALAPVGKVLWAYGGGWNYDDTGADEAVRSIGLSSTWLDFFDSEDADYDVSETWSDDGKNPHHEKGLDNAGYLSWSIYNTLFSESLAHDGFVAYPNEIVELLSDYVDFESADDLAGKTPAEIAAEMRPGDFAMMPGQHIYISLGKCEDSSMLISHSAMGYSSTGAYGGSVQISAVIDENKIESDTIEGSETSKSPKNQENEEEIEEAKNPENLEQQGKTEEPTNSEELILAEQKELSQEQIEAPEAVELAEKYMAEYPEWDERYDAQTKNMSFYMNFYNYAEEPEANGVFHWKDGVLEDPDGYREMTAAEIMQDLYK